MTDIIFHHYPQSPVSEKVRIAFGIKNLSWRSVHIPRIPPKPDLMALTGGYRRTPVMQMGADIYCDSHCILRALEERFPTPSFFPDGDHGSAWAFAGWADGPIFNDAVRLVLGCAADSLPEDFAKDRGRLYMGPDWDLRREQAAAPHYAAQIRAAFTLIEGSLRDGRPFLHGAAAGLKDAIGYYLVWFIRGRWADGPGMLSAFPKIEAWERRLHSQGHGNETSMESGEALQIARETTSAFPTFVDEGDPQGLQTGQHVSITPNSDGGDPSVSGSLHRATPDTVSILRTDPLVGEVCVHFPRAGYRISAD